MGLNRTSEWKLWPFQFIESFHCSISSVSIYYVPKSDIRVKIYDHLNFSRGSIVQYWASQYIIRLNRTSESKFLTIWISRDLPLSRYIMSSNRTSEWKVITIWISRDLPLFNVERRDILWGWIGPPCEKLWKIEFLESFRCSIASIFICDVSESDLWLKRYDHLNFSWASIVQFRPSRYFTHLNLTSVWKFMTIWIFRELSLFNFECLEILCAWIWPLCRKLWPFEFLDSFLCSIYIVSIYYSPESDIRVKS